jgi:hypothetical protein
LIYACVFICNASYVHGLFQAQAEARQKGISDKSEAELQMLSQQQKALGSGGASGDGGSLASFGAHSVRFS